MKNDNTKINSLDEILGIKHTYKELIFTEHEYMLYGYNIYMLGSDGAVKEVAEMLLDCKDDTILDYDIEVNHVSNPSNTIFVADFPKTEDVFGDADLLEKIRFALITIENYLYSNGGENAWKYKE